MLRNQYATIEEFNQVYEDTVTDKDLQNASEYIDSLVWPNKIVIGEVDYSLNVKWATIHQTKYFLDNEDLETMQGSESFSLGDLSVTESESNYDDNMSQKALHYLRIEGLLYSGIKNH